MKVDDSIISLLQLNSKWKSHARHRYQCFNVSVAVDNKINPSKHACTVTVYKQNRLRCSITVRVSSIGSVNYANKVTPREGHYTTARDAP
jgi:hypothetical protein